MGDIGPEALSLLSQMRDSLEGIADSLNKQPGNRLVSSQELDSSIKECLDEVKQKHGVRDQLIDLFQDYFDCCNAGCDDWKIRDEDDLEDFEECIDQILSKLLRPCSSNG